jgi:putative hydrolase of the HAD superfamily
VRFRAVFFDAGETMIYPHPSFPELFAHVLREAGHTVEPEKVLDTVSVYSKRFADAARAGSRGWTSSRESSRAFWQEIYRDFLADVGVKRDHEALADQLYRRFSDPASYRAYPDVLPTLQVLDERGYTLGVISNFEDWLELVFEAAELTRYFPVRVISGVEGVEKPDERIFRIALDRAGVRAEDSVYVGDHPFFDVEASAALGMYPVLIDRRNRYPEVAATRIASLTELPDLLESR